MKRIVLLVILFLMTTFFVFSEDTVHREFNVSKGKKLEIDVKGRGNVRISGWEKELAAITLRFIQSTPDRWDTSFKETSEGIEVELEEKRKNSNREAYLDIDVRLPFQFDLKLKVYGGETSIENLEGEISGKTFGGNMRLSHLKGDINIKASDGDITLSDSRLDGKLRAIGGRVLFENVTGDVEGISIGGNVIHQNAGKEKGTSGGKAIRITAMGGDININEAPDGAKVKTSGGSIRIKSARGNVEAVTSDGDIIINSSGGRVEAITTGGDITVTVPQGLSMHVDIEVVCTRDAEKEYNIFSDFPLEIERTDTLGLTGKNRSGKYIHGKAIISGGEHKIKLKTVNGNIHLLKSK